MEHVHTFNKYGECQEGGCTATTLSNSVGDRFIFCLPGTVRRENSGFNAETRPCTLQLEYEIRELAVKDHHAHTNRYEVPVLINIMEVEE